MGKKLQTGHYYFYVPPPTLILTAHFLIRQTNKQTDKVRMNNQQVAAACAWEAQIAPLPLGLLALSLSVRQREITQTEIYTCRVQHSHVGHF